jgi:hypothetical protein
MQKTEQNKNFIINGHNHFAERVENGRFYYLLAQWHSRAQGGREGHNFGDSRAERQILFQNNTSQNRLHLWNSRA